MTDSPAWKPTIERVALSALSLPEIMKQYNRTGLALCHSLDELDALIAEAKTKYPDNRELLIELMAARDLVAIGVGKLGPNFSFLGL